MPTGNDLKILAETRLSEKYLNVLVPKNNPNWHGPWDCAEFISWVVFQVTSRLYGCSNNAGDPATQDAYSGYWVRDAVNGTLPAIAPEQATVTAGLVLIRKPPIGQGMGHVALADGTGKVLEAAGVNLGVRRGNIQGRLWHYCVRIPGVTYAALGAPIATQPLPNLLQLTDPRTVNPLVKKVQKALKAAGFDPGPVDGEYGPNTVVAVAAFQKSNRLVCDGTVGPLTAKKLGIDWP